MYLPRHFEETRIEELHRLIKECPLGMLVTAGAHGLDANHLPFELDSEAGQRGRLLAHVARANPVWREVNEGDEVLVVFRGGDAYISPNWYPSKHEFHRQVPTWNYQAVHVHGRISIRDDDRFVRGVVARLTRTHERASGQDRPWRMTDSSKEYINEMLAAIVGVEIEITTVTGKWKLSQNKDERDRRHAAEELQNRGERLVSAAMRESLDGGS